MFRRYGKCYLLLLKSSLKNTILSCIKDLFTYIDNLEIFSEDKLNYKGH